MDKSRTYKLNDVNYQALSHRWNNLTMRGRMKWEHRAHLVCRTLFRGYGSDQVIAVAKILYWEDVMEKQP